MKVKELIRILAELNPESEVVYKSDGFLQSINSAYLSRVKPTNHVPFTFEYSGYSLAGVDAVVLNFEVVGNPDEKTNT